MIKTPFCLLLCVNSIILQIILSNKLNPEQTKLQVSHLVNSHAEPLNHSGKTPFLYETRFNFILNPNFKTCQEYSNTKRLDLLIYVHSSPGNMKRRILIRETWAQRSLFENIKLVFMMGSSNNDKINKLLKLEFNTYQDIVQQDFIDSYRNLTYKCIMSLEWINKFCSNVNYILKTDDDVILNTFEIIPFIKSLNITNAMICNGWKSVKVNRNKTYKWYVSKDEYSAEKYNDYCCGFTILFNGHLAPLLYNQTFYTKFFWIDDYYMSGLLARKVNATLVFLNEKIVLDYKKLKNTSRKDNILSLHLKGSINAASSLWRDFFNFHLKKLFHNVTNI